MTRVSPADAWDHVSRNLAAIRRAIAAAAEAAGRDPASVALVAVTKTVPVAGIAAALAAGQTTFGENRVQEALPKIAALAGTPARFHLIGHLQTNKARAVAPFAMIESIDSLRLAEAVSARLTAPMPVLLEVNVAGEASKDGFAPEDVAEALPALAALPRLRVAGLMTVAPLAANAEDLRPVFRRLRTLRDALGLEHLSMGMTNDFAIAIAEGATIVRIGRAIFGDR